jgi:hypothetical protein
MVRPPYPFVILLSTLLLIPVWQGAAVDQVTFAAQTANWADAQPLGAHFVAVEVSKNLGSDNAVPSLTPAAPVEGSHFELNGSFVQVDSDYTDAFFENGITKAPVVPNLPVAESPIVHSSHVEFNDARITGTVSREGRFLMVFPLPGTDMVVMAPCAKAVAAQRFEVRAPSIMAARDDLVGNTTQALEVTPCVESGLGLRGDFVVVLWEWDGSIQAAESQTEFWSGKRPLETVDARPFLSQAQEVYLTVQDGEFRINGSPDRPPKLFVDSLDLSAPQVALTEGRIQSAVPIEGLPAGGQHIEVSGDLAVQLSRNANQVGLGVTGMRRISIDGQTSELTSTVAAPAHNFDLPILLGGVGLVVSGAALVKPMRGWRRAQTERLVYSGNRRFERTHLDEAEEVADLVLHRRPDHVGGHSLKARILEARGNWPGALTHFERASQLALEQGDRALAGRYAHCAAGMAVRLGMEPSVQRNVRRVVDLTSSGRWHVEEDDELYRHLEQLDASGSPATRM